MSRRCFNHNDQEAIQFCTECKKLLCIICVIGHTKSHKVVTFLTFTTDVIRRFYEQKNLNDILRKDISNYKLLIRQKVITFWEELKKSIINAIEIVKKDSLIFIDKLIANGNKNMEFDSKTEQKLIKLYEEKDYCKIYTSKMKVELLSSYIKEQEERRTLLQQIYNNLPSSIPNQDILNNYLLGAEEKIYSAVNFVFNFNYSAFLDNDKLNLVYAPIYYDTIKLPKVIENSSIVQVKDNVYLVGGNMGASGTEHFSSVYCISLKPKLKEQMMVEKASMLHARAWHGIGLLLDNSIYAIGGYNDKERTLRACEKYSIEIDRWRAIPFLSNCRWGLSVTIFNARTMYCFFGINEKTALTDIESFDCLDEERGWEEVYNPRKDQEYVRRCHAAIQVSNTDILIFGGDSGGISTEGQLYYNTSKGNITPSIHNNKFILCSASFHFPDRMNGRMIYKLALSEYALEYNMIKKDWTAIELYPLNIINNSLNNY